MTITIPGVSVELNVPVPMRDGIILRADVYRPDASGEFPVILIRIPYDKTQFEGVIYAHPSWYARHGYIVVSQDTRGRYASDGEFYPFLHEAEDGYDTIKWASHLPGSTGMVGTFGASYGGATQLLAATLRPPGLTAMVPAVTASQYYEGWTYRQGALSLGFAASWALSLGIESAARRGDDQGAAAFATAFSNALDWDWFLPLNDYLPLNSPDTAYFFDWLEHPTYDDYWRRWSIDEDYSRIDAAAMHVGGWYDIFLQGTVKNFVGLRAGAGSEAARQAQRLIIGPWYHIPWRALGGEALESASGYDLDNWQLEWFDQHLKGIGEVGDDAPVRLYILREGRWRNFADWPPSNSVSTPYYMHSDGRANSRYGDGSLSTEAPTSEVPDVYTYDPAAPPAAPGGHSCCFPHVAPMGPEDQFDREDWNAVLVYTSDPLGEPIYLIGDVSATIYAATSAVDTDFAMRLCVVDAAGVSTNVQEGIVRARFRDSLTAPTLVEPGKIYRYEIMLGPVGVRIDSGERIRVQVSSSDFPQWDRNLNTGNALGTEGLASAVVATQTVFHDAEHPSCVSLPVCREI